MIRVWDITLMICFSASVLFVRAEDRSDLPPPTNLTFKWKTPFTLHLTWEKPKDLEPGCKVNYTVYVSSSQDCSSIHMQAVQITQHRHIEWDISNENGVCICVAVNPEVCGIKTHSRYLNTTIPPPTVTLVKNLGYEYSHDKLKCTWSPADEVPDLGFYYWSPHNKTVIKCNDMKSGECVIHDTGLKGITTNMFYLFNGTYQGKPVNNTFMGELPRHYVKLSKPQLRIEKDGQDLYFKTDTSGLDEFNEDCYRFSYTYSVCDKVTSETDLKSKTLKVNYDSNCKYKARVQVIYSSKLCGAGKSDLSDEVEYGENRDPNMPALLAVIFIPLIVSCCLIVSLVLLRRHKNIIFPKIPEPTLILKDMLSNNIKMSEQQWSPVDDRLYVPIEEIVESKISLEPETPLVPTTTNATQQQV